MKISDLNKLLKTQEEKSKIISDIRWNEDGNCNNYFDDLNDIHETEIQFLDILVDNQHWVSITESMGFSKGINIGHWPAGASDRADAFLLTMYKIKNQSLEFLKTKSKEYQILHERLQYILP